MSGSTYQLVDEVVAHDGPVRSLCSGLIGDMFSVVSGCQSDSPEVRIWSVQLNRLIDADKPISHKKWVTALAYCNSGLHLMFPKGCLASGSMDGDVRIFDFGGIPIAQLNGHQKGVISLSWTTLYLLSGSWDGTAKVWHFSTHISGDVVGVCVTTLGSHENGVQVLGLSNGLIATTSTGESVNNQPANYFLRLWELVETEEENEEMKELGIMKRLEPKLLRPPLKDHKGSLRAIAAVPGISGFVTASNDGSLLLRQLDGSVISSPLCHAPEADGSPPFVLDCVGLDTPSGRDIVSCGEDGSVMVWAGTELLQSIPHPTSVWCVSPVLGSGGDFVTGGNDGLIRLFSKDPNRIATAGQAGVESDARFRAKADEMLAAKRRATKTAGDGTGAIAGAEGASGQDLLSTAVAATGLAVAMSSEMMMSIFSAFGGQSRRRK